MTEWYDVELEAYPCPVCGHDAAIDGWCQTYEDWPNFGGEPRWGTNFWHCCDCDTEVYHVPYLIERKTKWG